MSLELLLVLIINSGEHVHMEIHNRYMGEVNNTTSISNDVYRG